ncbi:MAG: sugar phosphate isomerase/epimerase [Oscillospiraceae bacterium]|nr:sugar phosphate isomerase/epimerase [Oscillospiraceae bacterium]
MTAIYDWFGYALPMAERYPLIKQAGFDGVLLWWGVDFPGSEHRAAPALARGAALTVENIHTPFEGVNDLWRDNLNGDELTLRFLQCVTDCADFQIPAMVMHLADGDAPPPCAARGLDRIKRIAEKAERHGVRVALENLHKSAHLGFVLGHINSPCVGFCYDSGHHHCCNPEDDLLGEFGSRVMALHLHDNEGGDGHGAREGDTHQLPFDGTVDWPEVMAKIKQTGYTGVVALEVLNKRHEELSAEGFLRLACERAKRLEALL